MSDDLTPTLEVQTDFVLLGRLPRGVKWLVNQHGMTNRTYPEADWIFWLQRARVSTTEAACLSMGWCPVAWAEWHSSVPLRAEIREIARPYLDDLVLRADIFANHRDAELTVGQHEELMISLSSARQIASVDNWDVAEEFRLPKSSSPDVGISDPPKFGEVVTRAIKQDDDRKFSRRELQIRAIETAVESLGFVALKIKTGDKGKVMAECKRADTEKLFGGSKWPFEGAWKQAVSQKRVRMDEHDMFARM